MERKREVICGSAALLISAVFFVCFLRVQSLAEIISSYGNINILVYGMTLVLFCLAFAAGMLLFSQNKKWNMAILENKKVKWTAWITLLAANVIFFVVMLYKETDQYAGVAYKYGWHTQPFLFGVVAFTLETAIFLWVYSNWKADGKAADCFVWCVYGILTILVWYSMDTPNIFGRGQSGDWFHAHAYYNSIYNVHWGMPYTDELTSVYGHYALLWKIPMKLIGGDFRKFVFLIAALGAFTHLCAFLVLHHVVKSRLLRILGAVAITFPILGMRGGYYWQVWPHRMVFPMILLLYAVLVLKKNKLSWKTSVGGYIICILAVIWNTETGMILAVAWAGMHLSIILSRQDFTWKKLSAGMMLHGAGVVGSFLGAFGTVNLYNILKHSPANTIKEFLIPLISDSYMTDILRLDLPMYPSAYMPELILFLMGVALGISQWKKVQSTSCRVSWDIHLIFFMSVSALGRMVYYINRPSYHNLDCCHFSAVILMACFGQKGLYFLKNREWKRIEKISFDKIIMNGIASLCVIVLLMLSTCNVLQFSQNSQIKENFHNKEEMDHLAREIADHVPANTFGFGLNVAELYSWLHWNTQYFSIDFSDLSVVKQGGVRLADTLKEQNIEYLLTTKSTLPIWERNNPEEYQWFCENYTVEKSFSISLEEYQFYIRK